MPSIEILVSPAGQSQVQTHGFEGTNCRAGSRFLERALGQTTHEQLTPAFYEAQIVTHAQEAERA
ncbi:MAG: DUF2997 domain-containing protein [Planctomycetota bacterium]